MNPLMQAADAYLRDIAASQAPAEAQVDELLAGIDPTDDPPTAYALLALALDRMPPKDRSTVAAAELLRLANDGKRQPAHPEVKS